LPVERIRKVLDWSICIPANTSVTEFYYFAQNQTVKIDPETLGKNRYSQKRELKTHRPIYRYFSAWQTDCIGPSSKLLGLKGQSHEKVYEFFTWEVVLV
jgi:hypothetical protein